MPNHCLNTITIGGSKNDISEFIKNELTQSVIHTQFANGIYFDIFSAWTVDTEWLEGLLIKYPSLWIKNIWTIVQDRKAGIWIGSKDGIHQLEWDEPYYEIL